MWCSDCQQDVPAVAQSAEGMLLCSRCQRVLDDASCDRIADSGIELSSFDLDATDDSPIQLLEQEEARLRRIGRQLRGSERLDSGAGLSSALRRQLGDPPAPPTVLPDDQMRMLSRRRAEDLSGHRSPSPWSWLISLLLWCGVAGFLSGAALLVWSAAFPLPQLWQWGLTTTIAAEGLLILSLTWMAVRLWTNGRKVNRQLSGVTGQLHEIERITGSLAGSRLSASQHYYEHFNQVASPHLLVANLRGQVDQLASRLAR